MGDVLSILTDFWDSYGGGLIDFALNLVIAGLILWLGGKAIRKVKKVLTNVISKASDMDPTIIGFLVSVVGALLNFFLFLIALDQIGIDNTTFIAASGAAFFALALAMEGSLENFAAGFMLLTFKPFKVGDYVQIAGETGHVEVLELFNTTLLSDEGAIIICPNGSVLGENIINYSAKASLRVEVEFSIPYGGDLDKAKELLEDAIFEDARILKDPEPEVFVKSFDDETLTLAAEVWVDPHDQQKIAFYLKEAVKPRFDAAGLSLDQINGDDSDEEDLKERQRARRKARDASGGLSHRSSDNIDVSPKGQSPSGMTPLMGHRRPRLTRGPLHLNISGYLVRTNPPRPKKGKLLEDVTLSLDTPIVPLGKLLWFSIEHDKLSFFFMKGQSADAALGSISLTQLEDCQPSTLDIPSDKLQYHPEQKDPSHPGLTGAAFSSLTQQRLEQKKRKEMARQSKDTPSTVGLLESESLGAMSSREPDYDGLSAKRLADTGFVMQLKNPKDPVWNMRVPEGEETSAAQWVDSLLAAARERKRRAAEGEL